MYVHATHCPAYLSDNKGEIKISFKSAYTNISVKKHIAK